jgi:hypothetical protein
MSGISRKVYKINIKLTNNDENDEKEFVIDNISQILLQNFAELSNNALPHGLTENNHIYMLKDNYYIDNEILKSIRGSKGEKNKYEFKNFGTVSDDVIINEFYKPILRYNDNIIKIKVLTKILNFAADSIEYSKKYTDVPDSKDPQQQEKQAKINSEKQAKIDLLREKINEITSLQPVDNTSTINKAIDDIIDNILRILIGKNVMSYLKSIYDNTNDKSAEMLEFRNNLSNIMLKINSGPETNINLNKLETYRYFLDDKNIEAIFEIIQNNIALASKNSQQGSYGYNNRPNLLNTPEMFKQILKENIKYVYPDKTNIETLAESEEQDILLFNNILYILKKIYLLDTTIISVVIDDKNKTITKKFFIKNLTLEEPNPFKIDKLKSVSKDKKEFYNAFINFKCDIKYINENPLLKINYIIDDTEILDKTNHLKVIEFEPKNFNKNQEFNKYSSTYIYDTFDYKPNESKINKILNTIKMQKIIKTKEELFYNDIALNEFNDLLNIKFKADTDPTKDEYIKKTRIGPNILYFLKNIIKLYNGKEITHSNSSYFVYDTLITNDISSNINSNPTNSVLNFYSISENKTIKYNNFKSEKILKNFSKRLQTLQLVETQPYYNDKFDVYKVESRDHRITRNSYYIFILFICYKADEKGNKPSLQKRLIGEVCLNRAKILDKAFYNPIYSKFNISETYLYNKLINLQKPKQAKTAKNKDIIPNPTLEARPNLDARPPLQEKISGGNKNHTRKKFRRN